eukprot:4644265-Karenia_brevis.AAC.1
MDARTASPCAYCPSWERSDEQGGKTSHIPCTNSAYCPSWERSGEQGGKTSHIPCTNNALSPKLRHNGGAMELGTPSQCFRKGFGGGYYQKIDPAKIENFLTDF